MTWLRRKLSSCEESGTPGLDYQEFNDFNAIGLYKDKNFKACDLNKYKIANDPFLFKSCNWDPPPASLKAVAALKEFATFQCP